MTKTALVTGMDSNANARAICSSLLKHDYQVVATAEDVFTPDSQERRLFDEAHRDLPAVVFEAVDFSSTESLSNLIQRLACRQYDVVINCTTFLALTPDGSLRDEGAEFDVREFSRVLQASVTPVAALCLGLKDQLRPGGSIINVTSSAAKEGAFATISYNASKAAIESLTKSLANVLGPSKGIRANSIAPGWIPPSPDSAADGVVAIANALTPSVARGTPQDVVAAVHYLIGSSFHNGSVLTLDGGVSTSYLPYLLESLQLRGVDMDETIHTLIDLLSDAKKRLV